MSATSAFAQSSAYALTTTSSGAQQLVRFNPSAPGAVTTVGTTGVTLTGIDFRPATNQLYGYDGDKLYIVDVNTGSASLAFDVGNVAGDPGFDFNPTVDRIRLVGSNGTNFRLNPLDGTTTIDGAYTFTVGDVNFGRVPSFTAVAYTNSDTDPTTGTALYAIDPTLGQLVRITSPNGGAINTVGSLGLGNFIAISGFDILTVGGTRRLRTEHSGSELQQPRSPLCAPRPDALGEKEAERMSRLASRRASSCPKCSPGLSTVKSRISAWAYVASQGTGGM